MERESLLALAHELYEACDKTAMFTPRFRCPQCKEVYKEQCACPVCGLQGVPVYVVETEVIDQILAKTEFLQDAYDAPDQREGKLGDVITSICDLEECIDCRNRVINELERSLALGDKDAELA